MNMKPEVKCKITDLLKDYVVLHKRIKTLYKLVDIYNLPDWCWLNSTHIKNRDNKWHLVGDVINIENVNIIKCEYIEDISVRNRCIHEIKKEIKRYHRLQSNIQNVLNSTFEIGGNMVIYRQYNTEEVPSQFKNKMNYTYYVSNLKTV